MGRLRRGGRGQHPGVPGPHPAQRAFQGLYTYLDLFDGTWRDREGYSDDQFFKAGHGAFDATRPLVEYRFEKKNPEDDDFAPLRAFLNGVDLTGTRSANYLLANADIPQMINYAAVTAIVQHVDSTTKNFYMSQDPTTGRWEIIPWDLDHTLGNNCCGVNSTFVTPAEPGDRTSELMRRLLAVPEWRAHVLPPAAHRSSTRCSPPDGSRRVRRAGRAGAAGDHAGLRRVAHTVQRDLRQPANRACSARSSLGATVFANDARRARATRARRPTS